MNRLYSLATIVSGQFNRLLNSLLRLNCEIVEIHSNVNNPFLNSNTRHLNKVCTGRPVIFILILKHK